MFHKRILEWQAAQPNITRTASWRAY